MATTEVKSANPVVESINPTTAIEVYKGPLQKPEPGTVEARRFATDAEQMMAILTMAETNPRAIVLWDGVPRICADLVRAWRKETYTSESKRLHRK